MSADRHARVREVFLQAIELDATNRMEFVLDQCQDEETRHEVESLLKNHHAQTILAATDSGSNRQTAAPRQPFQIRRHTRLTQGRWLADLLQTRTRRMIAILAAVVLVALLGTVTRLLIKRSLHSNVYSQLSALLDSHVLTLERWAEQTRQEARSWSRDERVQSSVVALLDNEFSRQPATDQEMQEWNILNGILGPYVSEEGTAGVVVVNRQGTIIYASLQSAVGLQLNDAGQKRLETVWQGNVRFYRPYPAGSWVQEVARLAFDRPVIWVVAPVSHEGEIVAALAFVRYGDVDFSDILSTIRMGKSGETYAFDANGLMLSKSRFERDLVEIGLLENSPRRTSMLNLQVKDPGRELRGKLALAEDRDQWPLTRLVREATNGNAGAQRASRVVEGRYRDYRGKYVLGAWAWLPRYELGIATELDLAEADRPLGYLSMTFGILLFVLACSAAGTIISSFLLVSLRREAAEALQVGQYTLGKLIGEGGMGRVYLARHAYLKRPTAVKLIKREVISKKMIARFEREVQLASQLTHPGTIEIYDYGRTEDGVFYYAMEYLDGSTLDKLVREGGALDSLRVIYLLKQVCGSLREAHEAGVVHRDIKPQNIMACCRGGMYDVVKVLDFGLVKSIEQQPGSEITALNQVVGTPVYMAPERIREPSRVDPRSDLYAIGATAYFLLTGRNPFKGANHVEIVSEVLSDVPARVSETIDQEIPEVLDQMIARCLAKRAEDRPQSANEMLQALSEYSPVWTQDQAKEYWRIANQGQLGDTELVEQVRGGTVVETDLRNPRVI